MDAASTIGYFLRFTLCHCVSLSAYVCTMYMQMSSEAREGIRSLGAGVATASCELPNVSAGSQTPELYKNNRHFPPLSTSAASYSAPSNLFSSLLIE